MRSILIIGVLFLFVCSGQLLAEPKGKDLIDTKPGESSLIDVEKWFQTHPIEKGAVRFGGVFKSPRGQVVFVRLKGAPLGRHIHTQIDDIVYIYKGRGEVYLNGKWTPVKAGDLHICPRGVGHTFRTGVDEELWLIDFFTVPMPPGGDRTMID